MTFGNAVNETRAAIVTRIVDHEQNRPRALQQEVGCSGLGVACQRQLAYRIKGVPGRKRTTSWVATIGTSVHAYLEQIFAADDRYLTEQPISVTHDGITIPGTIDLYDKETKTVVDFKVVGDTTLSNAKRGKLSDQYATQVQLYGLGLTQAGEQVDKVAILFLPKTKELSDAVFVERDFNPTMARQALSRYAIIKLAVANDAPMKDFTPTDAPCIWCEWFDPAATDIDKGCPGVLPQFNQPTR